MLDLNVFLDAVASAERRNEHEQIIYIEKWVTFKLLSNNWRRHIVNIYSGGYVCTIVISAPLHVRLGGLINFTK